MDYVCYCATKIITTQLCKQVYMSWPVVLASPEIARHSRTTVVGKTIVQTLGKNTVAYSRKNHSTNSRENNSC